MYCVVHVLLLILLRENYFPILRPEFQLTRKHLVAQKEATVLVFPLECGVRRSGFQLQFRVEEYLRTTLGSAVNHHCRDDCNQVT